MLLIVIKDFMFEICYVNQGGICCWDGKFELWMFVISEFVVWFGYGKSVEILIRFLILFFYTFFFHGNHYMSKTRSIKIW